MSRHPRALHLGRSAGFLPLALLLAGSAALSSAPRVLAMGPGPGQTRLEYLTRVRASKARARELMSEGAHRRMQAAQRYAALARAARRHGLPPPAAPFQRFDMIPVVDDDAQPSLEQGVSARRYAVHVAANVPVNVRANDPAADAVNTTQSGGSIAAWHGQVLVAWNDGMGPDALGFGWSSDGGLTFTDGGAPPLPAGWTWSGDPALTVDERSGDFACSALAETSATRHGIVVVTATVVGGELTWGRPVVVRVVPTATTVLQQPCLVADSTSGNLHLCYTTFDAATGDHIDYQRSTDGGVTWSAPFELSSVADRGAVEGPRAAVGPRGELDVTWSAIGNGPADFLRLRVSPDRGIRWRAETTPVVRTVNFGAGAPGSNRERGVDLPAIAVDRSGGRHHGRIHLAWTESVDAYDDALDRLGSVGENEDNDAFARANPFTPGQCLRGTLGARGDRDYFAFTAVQGTTYVFACDSIPRSLYTMRVFCGQDTTTRLASTGDVSAPAGGRGDILWTAPASGTYYLRIAWLNGGATGGYRIATGTAGAGLERARDARDVFSAWSDDGLGWSTPALVSDGPPRFAECLPEVAVAGDGMPYVSWFDWRDDGCGGRSYQYLSRSTDGGDTWGPGQRCSDAQNDWTSISLNSNLAPDMGEHGHLCVDGGDLVPAWTDGRGGSPDVYTERIATGFDLTTRQGDLAAGAGTTILPSWTVTNLNPLFANSYRWSLGSERQWALTDSGDVAVVADGISAIEASVSVPDSAAPGVNHMCLTVRDLGGAEVRQCGFDVTIQSPPVDVPILASAFDLQASAPDSASNRTRIDFRLPFDAPVMLRIYGLRGELIRTLADGRRPGGPNSVVWDGRDDRGSQAGAGAYFCRLEGFGSVKVQRLIWLR